MRRIALMLVTVAALLATVAAPAAPSAPVVADGACWTCNSAS